MRKQIAKLLCLAVCAFAALSGSAKSVTADYNVVPTPVSIQKPNASVVKPSFVLRNGTKVLYAKGNDKMKRNAEFLAEYVKKQTGITLKVKAGKPQVGAIALTLGSGFDNDEAYRLTVADGRVVIDGASEAGVFYGIQTLRKAISAEAGADMVVLPSVVINDRPRYSYRGVHLDVCRHFFTVDQVKEYLDILVLHNVNRFHWHLTEDQGWRIEIKSYPKLQTIASVRDDGNGGEYGGYYTQEQIKEVVAYAAERYIVTIPEIDMPGHMQAALAAYPELGCTGGPYKVRTAWGVSEDVLCPAKDEVYTFIDKVLNEVMDLFPSEYIHIGGDECPKVRWKQCPACQAKIKELGIVGTKQHSAEEQLQSYYIGRAEKMVNARGRRIIGWSEILEGGIAPDATLMAWLGLEGGRIAASQGHDVILTPTSHCYFDFDQAKGPDEPKGIGGFISVEKAYSFDPTVPGLTDEQQKHVIGVQCNLWTEYIDNFPRLQYNLLPRLAATSEVQWDDKNQPKNYPLFVAHMNRMAKIYDCYGWNYAKHIFKK